MRKLIFILSFLLCFFFSFPVYAAPILILNGHQIALDVAPVVRDDTILVPLQAIIEPLGGEMIIDQQTQTVVIKKDVTEIELHLGRSDALINGIRVDLSAPAQIVNGCAMVPLQLIAVALDAETGWDADTQTIVINASVSASHGIKSLARVHFIDVGQGDAIFIQLPGQIDILIDGGNLDAEGTVLHYLEKQNVDALELVIATNSNAHHIGALPAVLSRYKVKKLIYSGSPVNVDNLLLTAQRKSVPREAANYQSYTWNDISFLILNGPVDDNNKKEHSIISRLKAGNIEFLFMSDANIKEENDLQGDITAQILKVGDHGNASATSQRFINRVKPEAAIISLIGDNPKWYGHYRSNPPAPEVLDRLQSKGTKVFRTDLDGTLTVTTDGWTYNISHETASIEYTE